MVHSKPRAVLYSSLLIFILLLFSSEIAFSRVSASSKSKEKTGQDLLMKFGSYKVTRRFSPNRRSLEPINTPPVGPEPGWGD
ncbi:hypothetical protein ABKV19_020423 [Rosa sericea]